MLLNDSEIKSLALDGMIKPFVDHQVRVSDNGEKIISYGLSSCSYDVRLGSEFVKLLGYQDTKEDCISNSSTVGERGVTVVGPNETLLGVTVEEFDMPDDVAGLVVGKSTYARCGLSCLCTPIEPAWKGFLTLEFVSGSGTVLYPSEGIASIQFHRIKKPMVSYAGRNGKYMNQEAKPVLARL